MQKIVVTLKTNVQVDENANILNDDDGNILLNDDEDVGVLLKTHGLQVAQMNQETNVLETGVVFRAEVLWNLHRSPAPAMVDPADLVWLSLDDESDDDEVDDEPEGEEVEGRDVEPSDDARDYID